MEAALAHLKATEGTDGLELFDFSEFSRLIGFEDIWAFERKWARDDK